MTPLQRFFMAWALGWERRCAAGEPAPECPFPVVLRPEVGLELYRWAVGCE